MEEYLEGLHASGLLTSLHDSQGIGPGGARDGVADPGEGSTTCIQVSRRCLQMDVPPQKVSSRQHHHTHVINLDTIRFTKYENSQPILPHPLSHFPLSGCQAPQTLRFALENHINSVLLHFFW